MADHRFQVLKQLAQVQITLEEAAGLLKTQPKYVRRMIQHHGDRLETINQAIDRLQSPANSKREQTEIKKHLATTLNVTMRSVNRVLLVANVVIPAPISVESRTKRRKTAQKRRKMQYAYAAKTLAGCEPVTQAARKAKVSARQMYRLISKLRTTIGVDYRDLKHATPEQRRHVAQLVAIEQGLE